MSDTETLEFCPKPSRRGGGRAARKAARAAPLPDNMRPVRPGLEGGTFRPLTDPPWRESMTPRFARSRRSA